MNDKHSFYQSLLTRRLSRRDFIKLSASLLALLPFSEGLLKPLLAKEPSFNGRPKRKIKAKHDLVVIEGKDPYTMTVKAIEAMGGMGTFVKKNAVVVIKPNICGYFRPPGTTNPEVVAALVDLCYKVGAKRVNVFDSPKSLDPLGCYAYSGIQKAAAERGAYVYILDSWDVLKAHFPYESPMEGWPIFRDMIECDTFINVPILKHHNHTRLTLSMKNLMGVCAGNRGFIHQDMDRKLVDLTDFIKPELTVVDAFRVLLYIDPAGRNKDVVYKNKILVSTDPTLADMFACSIVDVDPQTVRGVKEAIQLNFGITDIRDADIAVMQT